MILLFYFTLNLKSSYQAAEYEIGRYSKAITRYQKLWFVCEENKPGLFQGLCAPSTTHILLIDRFEIEDTLV